MIILRQKLFRRDSLPSEKFEASPEVEKEFGVTLKIKIKTSKKYDKQINTALLPTKIKIKALVKDIKEGNIYNDGKSGGDTHFLSDFSHKNSHVLSKKVNEEDRLNYRVYRPRLQKLQNDKWDYSMTIVLESCIGHELNGTPDYIKDKSYKTLKQNKNKS